MLDSEEYFHLAINATQNNQHHAALEYLHKCLELSPDNAQAIFLLAAEHAELGLYNRAIEGMEKCLALDPNIEMAYYQLALLHIQQGSGSKSTELWQHLSENSSDPILMLFAKGMLLLDTDKSQAIELMREASQQETHNKALLASIDNIMSKLVADTDISTESTVKDSEPLHSIYLHAYKDSAFDTNEN